MGKEFRGGGNRGANRGGNRGGKRGGGRGGNRGRGRGGIGSKKFSKPKTEIQPHRFEGVYILKSGEEVLATKNLAPGESVYGEKRVTIELPFIEIKALAAIQQVLFLLFVQTYYYQYFKYKYSY